MYLKLMNWDRDYAAGVLPMFLRDSASIWYDSLGEENKATWTTVKTAFEERFLPHPAMRWANLDRFNSRAQRPNESVDDYVQEMLKRGNDLQKSQAEIMETIIRGLSDYISQFVIEREPKTMSDTLHYAKLAESIKRKPGQDDAARGVAALAAQIAQLQASMTELASIRLDAGVMPATASPLPTDNRHPNQQYYMSDNQPVSNQSMPPQYTPRPGNSASGFQPRPAAPAVPLYGQRTMQCYACHDWGHSFRTCRFNRAQCRGCLTVGHILKACPKRQGAAQQ
ncbi:uncharacterized protein [Littorina saxatilis]|uniref:uncharacterized protein n=1 Tax=Littorina saxatilis TaxID=31220 RepID=UPI0038B50E71